MEAEGVSAIEGRFLTFIEDIGFRSPTAIVTGSVTFEGGNPVQDVIIQATPQGSIANNGSALRITPTHKLFIENITGAPTTTATLQAWVRPQTPFSTDTDPTISVFEMQASGELPSADNPILVNYQLLPNANQLKVSVNGRAIVLHNFFPSGEVNAQGNDVLIPVSEANNAFVHLSVLLSDGGIPQVFINGRLIDEDFLALVLEQDAFQDFNISLPTQPISLSLNGNTTPWDDIFVGGQKKRL